MDNQRRVDYIYRKRTLIIIPAWNEEETIGDIIRELTDIMFTNILVLDDKSDDQTSSVASAAGAKVFQLPIHLGAWGAIQTGFRYALERDYQYIITMDADGQHIPQTIHSLLMPLVNHEADVVVGSCVERASRARQLAWQIFRKLSGLKIRDLTSGFRAYNSKAIQILASADATLLDYQDVGVLLLLQKSKCRIIEVDVPMHPRFVGHSRVFNSWGCVFWYLLHSGTLCLSKSHHIQTPFIKRKEDDI